MVEVKDKVKSWMESQGMRGRFAEEGAGIVSEFCLKVLLPNNFYVGIIGQDPQNLLFAIFLEKEPQDPELLGRIHNSFCLELNCLKSIKTEPGIVPCYSLRVAEGEILNPHANFTAFINRTYKREQILSILAPG